MAAQIGLSIGEPRGRPCRRSLRRCAPSATSTTAAGSTLTGSCCAASRTGTLCAGGRAALLTRGGLNGTDYLHHNKGGKNDCQDND